MEYNIVIGAEIGPWEVSKEYIADELAKCKGKPCTVRINSYGGDVQTALDIRQQFMDHGDVTAYIFGLTASAATILAMGAKTIKISRYASMLIHCASLFYFDWGQMNAAELDQHISRLQSDHRDLNTFDDIISAVYAERTGKTPAEMLAIMKEAAWLNADRAVEIGLADEIFEDDEKPKLTASAAAHFRACHWPIPQTSRNPLEKAKDLFAKFDDNMRELRDFFTGSKKVAAVAAEEPGEDTAPEGAPEGTPAPEENVKPNNITHMDKVTNLLACLGLESIVMNDGSCSFTAEQIQKIEDSMAQAATAAEQSAEQIRQLNAELETLKKADGDETPSIEGSEEGQEASDAVSSCRNFCRTYSGLI